MTFAEQLKEERTGIMYDIYENRIPKRVPIEFSVGPVVIADLAGIDRFEAFWNPEILKDALDDFYSKVKADTSMFWGGVYTPYSAQALNARNRAISSTGMMQHPNTMCMYPEEYDEFIEDPLAFVVEKAFPRVYGYLDNSQFPARSALAVFQEAKMTEQMNSRIGKMVWEMDSKYGKPDYEPNVGGFSRVPLDWMADQLRSFDGISIDIRRNRAKVIAAEEAAYPILYKVGLPADPAHPNRHGAMSFQLHMAPYMRDKDFEDVWYTPWKRQLEDYASLGMRCGAFLEEDWSRRLDYLLDLPTGMVYQWEKGDPRLFKDKLGKKCILSGGFPIIYLKTLSKSEIVDKTKEWLDIMMDGGAYIFGFDKNALSGGDINMENLIAVFDTVLEYGVYSDAGKQTGEIFKKEDYSFSDPAPVSSRAYISWERYKEMYPYTPESAKNTVMAMEDMLLNTVFYMSC